MTSELSERFRYPGGEQMNGFYICKKLTETELDICIGLEASGPLGLGEENIVSLGIDISIVQALVNDGVVRKTTLLQLACDLTGDELRIVEMKEWMSQGGFDELDREGDRKLFRNFEQALKIVEQGEVPENLVPRYQVITDLYNYINLIYDDR